jgi:hypothetical protein
MSIERTPDLRDVIEEAVRAKVATIHTAIPGVVVSYDAATQMATVRIRVNGRRKQRDGTVSTYAPPIIAMVPVVMPGGVSSGLTVPLDAGDPVMIHFSERDHSRWLQTGEQSDPVDVRRFDRSDAVAVPGCFPLQGVTRPADSVADGPVLYGDAVYLGSGSASDFVALASLVDDNFSELRSFLLDFYNRFNAHVHGTAGTPPVTPPFTPLPPTFDGVGSTKVRSE